MDNKSKVRVSQVYNQLEDLSSELDELENAINILAGRLQSVLREEVEDKSFSEDTENLVSLAVLIRNNALEVNKLTANISSICSRLEI